MILAVTGKLGSGKSTVASFFADLGCSTIDADKIGHKLLEKEEIKKKLKEEFGEEIGEGNTISRKKLSEVVFHDIDNLKKLNNIIHPSLIQKIKEKIVQNKINVIDAALYYELNLNNIADKTLLVKCSEEKILERLKNIKLFQRTRFQKEIREPGYIIDNNGTLEETRERVKIIFSEIK